MDQPVSLRFIRRMGLSLKVRRRKKFKSIGKVEGWSNEQFKDGHEFQRRLHFREMKRECIQNQPRLWRVRNTKASSMTATPSSQAADQVRKLGLIFIYYKSEASGWSGQEIGTDLHLLQVQGRRLPIRQGNWDWSSPTTSPRWQADQVRKIGLIFTYYSYKSEVAGRRSGLEIQTRPTPSIDC